MRPGIDITNCDKEQIHLVGKIQNHGGLISINPNNGIITDTSQNIKNFINKEPKEIIGKLLSKVLNSPYSTNKLPKCFNLRNYRDLIFITHQHQGRTIIEIETYNDALSALNDLEFLENTFAQFNEEKTEGEISNLLSGIVQQYLGYDRVMIYKFDENWNGNVVGEKTRGKVTSYFNHNFPAEDIPSIARQMLVKKISRQITDVHTPSIPIIQSDSKAPLDLLHSELRYPSLIHLEFLKNMNVTATFTVSILVKGQLWGIIACQHESGPLHVPYSKRKTCEALARYFGNYLQGVQEEFDDKLYRNLIESQNKIVEAISKHSMLKNGFEENAASLLALHNASGIAFKYNTRLTLFGNTPDAKHVNELVEWIGKKNINDIYFTDCLSKEYPKGKELQKVASGILVLSIFNSLDEYIIWFRPEKEIKQAWAGDPAKIVVDEGQTLHPRKSFKTWYQSIKGHSKPWDKVQVKAAKVLRWELIQIKLTTQNTDLKDLLAEKTKAQRELKKSNEHLEDFAYTVAHDLKSPLRGINNLLSFLSEDHEKDLPKGGNELIALIKEKILFMHNMISEILSASKREGINSEQVIDLNTFIPELTNRIKFSSKVKITQDNNLPIVVYNASQLNQIFRNLIDNSIKYSDKSPTRIHISSVLSGNNWEISVQDNGIGIPKKYHKEIFVPFNKVSEKISTKKKNSTGIGLSIIKKIITENKGVINIESEEKKGTRIYFTIPVYESKVAV